MVGSLVITPLSYVLSLLGGFSGWPAVAETTVVRVMGHGHVVTLDI